MKPILSMIIVVRTAIEQSALSEMASIEQFWGRILSWKLIKGWFLVEQVYSKGCWADKKLNCASATKCKQCCIFDDNDGQPWRQRCSSSWLHKQCRALPTFLAWWKWSRIDLIYEFQFFPNLIFSPGLQLPLLKLQLNCLQSLFKSDSAALITTGQSQK